MKSSAVIYLLLLSLLSEKFFSQDPVLSNPGHSLVYLNPSFAGTNGLIRNQFMYSKAWALYSGAPQTFINSTDIYLPGINGGIAASVMTDKLGPRSDSQLSIAYAQHFSLTGELKLIPSLKLLHGVRKIQSDWITIAPGQELNNRNQYVDYAGGFLMMYKDLFFGTSVSHFTRPEENTQSRSFSPRRIDYYVSYNYLFNGANLFNFSAHFVSDRAFSSLSLSANFLLLKHLMIGSSYSLDNVAYATLGYRQNSFNLQLGCSKHLANNRYEQVQLSMLASLTLRTNEKKIVLTSLETW